MVHKLESFLRKLMASCNKQKVNFLLFTLFLWCGSYKPLYMSTTTSLAMDFLATFAPTCNLVGRPPLLIRKSEIIAILIKTDISSYKTT